MKVSFKDNLNERTGIFDTEVPPFGHFERFEQRLEKHEKRKTLRWRNWVIVSSIAATVAIILMLQLTYPIRIPLENRESVKEVAQFYRQQLNEEVQKIEQQLDLVDPGSRPELQHDIESLKSSASQSPRFPPHLQKEEKIAIIVQQYNIYMESLQYIQEILNNIPEVKHKL